MPATRGSAAARAARLAPLERSCATGGGATREAGEVLDSGATLRSSRWEAVIGRRSHSATGDPRCSVAAERILAARLEFCRARPGHRRNLPRGSCTSCGSRARSCVPAGVFGILHDAAREAHGRRSERLQDNLGDFNVSSAALQLAGARSRPGAGSGSAARRPRRHDRSSASPNGSRAATAVRRGLRRLRHGGEPRSLRALVRRRRPRGDRAPARRLPRGVARRFRAARVESDPLGAATGRSSSFPSAGPTLPVADGSRESGNARRGRARPLLELRASEARFARSRLGPIVSSSSDALVRCTRERARARVTGSPAGRSSARADPGDPPQDRRGGCRWEAATRLGAEFARESGCSPPAAWFATSTPGSPVERRPRPGLIAPCRSDRARRGQAVSPSSSATERILDSSPTRSSAWMRGRGSSSIRCRGPRRPVAGRPDGAPLDQPSHRARTAAHRSRLLDDVLRDGRTVGRAMPAAGPAAPRSRRVLGLPDRRGGTCWGRRTCATCGQDAPRAPARPGPQARIGHRPRDRHPDAVHRDGTRP